ncbi:MAG: lytic murein transglycosylase, partial [Methylophaga nitratireducenticrescens]
MPDEQIEVMGVHLGSTSYAEIQQLWREAGEVALFMTE